MLDYLIVICLFNLIYFNFGLDIFVVNLVLKRLERVEETLNLDDDLSEELTSVKASCVNYEKELRHNLFTVCFDLIVSPIYILALFLSCLYYLRVGK